ncbi:MAG: acyl carrier protein [Verrucomicrobiae bacterium]
MREITTHKVNGCNEAIQLHVMDEPGDGGASHKYMIEFMNTSPENRGRADRYAINFQKGPIGISGVNGITQEVLIAICIDRLECFQKGPFACEDNMDALCLLRAAQNALHRRTRDRLAKGIEGTHIVDTNIPLIKKHPLFDRLQKVIVDQLGVNPAQVTPEASFIQDLGADSLDIVELVFAFEEEFKTEFADEDTEKVITVEDALKLIESNLNNK